MPTCLHAHLFRELISFHLFLFLEVVVTLIQAKSKPKYLTSTQSKLWRQKNIRTKTNNLTSGLIFTQKNMDLYMNLHMLCGNQNWPSSPPCWTSCLSWASGRPPSIGTSAASECWPPSADFSAPTPLPSLSPCTGSAAVSPSEVQLWHRWKRRWKYRC